MPGFWIIPVGLVVLLVGLFLACLVFEVVRFRWRRRRLLKSPPVKRTPCPVCGHMEHEYKAMGLWDGPRDPVTGNRPGGSYDYGVCKGCGSRWARWDDDPPYVPSDEEWQRETVMPKPEATSGWG